MENQKFLGKYLLRKSKLRNGKFVVTITGIFQCDNPELINDNDEMWVSELTVTGTEMIKFKDCKGTTSPEDFLEGEKQHPNNWEQKEKIIL